MASVHTRAQRPTARIDARARGTCDAESTAMMTRTMSLAILVTACTATRSFTGIAGSGPDDVWVVGASTPAESDSSSPYVFHWDGTAWTSRADVATSGLSGVWSPTANNVWFAGDTMLHYDGTTWTSALGQNYTRAVWGDGSGTVWAVGLDGLTVRVDPSGTQTRPGHVAGGRRRARVSCTATPTRATGHRPRPRRPGARHAAVDARLEVSGSRWCGARATAASFSRDRALRAAHRIPRHVRMARPGRGQHAHTGRERMQQESSPAAKGHPSRTRRGG